MARSRKKTPIFGMTTAESDKADKVAAHRSARHRARQLLHVGVEDIPSSRDIENPWKYSKDGKRFWRDAQPEHMRK
jgi:hypothetical protein